jgi:hypothetical protein
MIDPLFARVIALGLALLLLSAAWHKLAARAEFLVVLRGYELLPAALLRPVATLIPGVEAVLAVAWLVGAARDFVAIATAVLLLAYAAAIAINLHRGRLQIDCGCGLGAAAGGSQQLSGWLVARNLMLAGLALLAAFPATVRVFGIADVLTLAAATAAAVLLYAGSSQLIRNAAGLAGRRVLRG